MDVLSKHDRRRQLRRRVHRRRGRALQFEIVKHACTVGARVFCGSSAASAGCTRFEALAVTATAALPMVCLVGNRALDDPGAFGVEHNDALAVRDLGWLLCWVDTAQEALDTSLIAYRIAEDRRVCMPMAIWRWTAPS